MTYETKYVINNAILPFIIGFALGFFIGLL